MNAEEFERLLREFLSRQGVSPADAEQFLGTGLSPQDLALIFSRMAHSTVDVGSAVDWELAKRRALEVTNKQRSELEEQFQIKSSKSSENQVSQAFQVASLWLADTTELSTTLEPKLLSRELWVLDSLPLFQRFAEPIAEGMATALGDNLGELLPEEFGEFAASAGTMLKRAGASLFAVQLGSALGQFALDALVAGEVGIPISNRPGVVLPNAILFAKSLGLPEDQLLLYLALRELALHSLFASATWLEDQVVSQVREYAAGLTIDLEQLREFAETSTELSPDELARNLSSAGLVAQRSEVQLQALERIEFILALIEGWVDSIAHAAGTRLPALPQIAEAIRRRRAAGGVGEKTFETLLGLELRPKLLRESSAAWTGLADALGRASADRLWSHPDLLPSPEELMNLEALISRITTQDDDFDRQLRDLLE